MHALKDPSLPISVSKHIICELVSEFILFTAAELGIKELVPAYLDPSLQIKDLSTGVSFASGATGYDPQTSKLVIHKHIS